MIIAPTRPKSIERWPIVVFCVLACGLAWAVASPLWLSDDGLSHPLSSVVILMMMYTPLLAASIVMLLMRRFTFRSASNHLGIRLRRPAKRVIVGSILGIGITPLVIAAGLFLAAALSWVTLDLQRLSGFREELARVTGGDSPIPVNVIAAVQLATIPFAAVANGLFAFGEEVGWRGFLLPLLQPLGCWPAITVSGIVWGVWHAPIVLLGYNFTQPNALGLILMVVATVLIGTLFSWLRIWSGSIWPVVFAHGALNATGGLVGLFSAAGHTVNLALAGPLGVGTWIACSFLIGILLVLRRVRHRRRRRDAAPLDDRSVKGRLDEE